MQTLYTILFVLLFSLVFSQDLYFPYPEEGSYWDTISPTELNWCADSLQALNSFLDENNTHAFIILKDGKIALEWYFQDFGRDSIWYWASAGKSLTAVLMGMAQQQGLLDIEESTSAYLGEAWTNCTTTDEDEIQLIHQLTMTSGLDDAVPDVNCTYDTCLECFASPGMRWAYHNAPYTLLLSVIEEASGMGINAFYNQYLANEIGMSGAFITSGYNRIMFSKARSMARFGLFMLAGGSWNGDTLLTDRNYFEAMTQTSQSMNYSYGYLWWLNGKGAHMLPGSQQVFPWDLIPEAPDDLYAGLGKNDQKVYVVPSENMVVVRMGQAAGTPLPGPSGFDNLLWRRIMGLTSTVNVVEEPFPEFRISPNPVTNFIRLSMPASAKRISILSFQGTILLEKDVDKEVLELDISGLEVGIYLMSLQTEKGQVLTKRFIKL